MMMIKIADDNDSDGAGNHDAQILNVIAQLSDTASYKNIFRIET